MRAFFAVFIWLWATALVAQDDGLTSLETGDDARGWEAVGRIDFEGRGFCTGALIAPDLVLTAAHCLFHRDTGTRISPEDIQFLAGFRNGRALAYRDVSRIVIHAGYHFEPRVSNSATRYDLALLQLAQPIRLAHIRPFATAHAVRPGDEVGVVSYAHDRADAPALEEVCTVLGSEDEVIVISCDVDYGASGSPIFQIRDGVAQIVSVVSAKATLDGAPVALGTSLLAPLADLRAALAEANAGFGTRPPSGIRVLGPGEQADTGARSLTVASP